MPYVRKGHVRTLGDGTKKPVRKHIVRNDTRATKPRPSAPGLDYISDDGAFVVVEGKGATAAEQALQKRYDEARKLSYEISYNKDPLTQLPHHKELAEGLFARLRSHHASHTGSLDKNKFEDAVESTYREIKVAVKKTRPGHPGADIEIENTHRWSLKTEGGQSISETKINLTKFMEFSKSRKNLSDMKAVKKVFYEHMEDYDKILVLRCLTPRSSDKKIYELVEIPLSLLERAKHVKPEVSERSGSEIPPTWCTVYGSRKRAGEPRNIDFQLYYTGGDGTRKVQIKHLNKELCIVHARFEFDILDHTQLFL